MTTRVEVKLNWDTSLPQEVSIQVILGSHLKSMGWKVSYAALFRGETQVNLTHPDPTNQLWQPGLEPACAPENTVDGDSGSSNGSYYDDADSFIDDGGLVCCSHLLGSVT